MARKYYYNSDPNGKRRGSGWYYHTGRGIYSKVGGANTTASQIQRHIIVEHHRKQREAFENLSEKQKLRRMEQNEMKNYGMRKSKR